jgi:hypothetical protein
MRSKSWPESERSRIGVRHDGGRPLSSQEECYFAERIAGAESLGRLGTVAQYIGLSLFDEVDGGSVVVDRDDFGACFDVDLTHHARELVELCHRQIGEDRKSGNPARIHAGGSCHKERRSRGARTGGVCFGASRLWSSRCAEIHH